MKKITIVSPCFNEDDNVEELVNRVKSVFKEKLKDYEYEHIFIDNDSSDNTLSILKKIAQTDKNVKIIVNSRNFGPVRSPYYGLLQGSGDATIMLASDLQDPPEMIEDFVNKWAEGYETVIAIKKDSDESRFMYKIREGYYKLLGSLSNIKLYKNFTGFGLYDKKVIKALSAMPDAYPFLRGMIVEVGYSIATIEYHQPVRMRGISKHNFYSLYDFGILGIISNSKIPLRVAIFMSMIFGVLSLLVGLGYLVAKLLYWDEMQLGIAPLLIGGSLAFSIVLFFIGIIGEYIGAIYTQILNRPLVFEKERINFDK